MWLYRVWFCLQQTLLKQKLSKANGEVKYINVSMLYRAWWLRIEVIRARVCRLTRETRVSCEYFFPMIFYITKSNFSRIMCVLFHLSFTNCTSKCLYKYLLLTLSCSMPMLNSCLRNVRECSPFTTCSLIKNIIYYTGANVFFLL